MILYLLSLPYTAILYIRILGMDSLLPGLECLPCSACAWASYCWDKWDYASYMFRLHTNTNSLRYGYILLNAVAARLY